MCDRRSLAFAIAFIQSIKSKETNMGCFDSTCAFSRTAIHCGDEVLLVALDYNNAYRKDLLETYRLMNQLFDYKRRKKAGRFDSRYDKSPFRFIGVGIYNDYGSIEGFDNDIPNKIEGSWWDYQFFVHKSVAEGLLDRSLDLNNLEEDAIELIELAFIARVQLKGNAILGAQYFDKNEIDIQRKLTTLTNLVLDRHQDYLSQYEDDDEESD